MNEKGRRRAVSGASIGSVRSALAQLVVQSAGLSNQRVDLFATPITDHRGVRGEATPRYSGDREAVGDDGTGISGGLDGR